MDFINLRSVFNRKVSAKNPLLFIYKPVGCNLKEHCSAQNFLNKLTVIILNTLSKS